MTFASLTFFIFFAIVLIILSITNIPLVEKIMGNNLNMARHIFLLMASYVFYGWWNWKFCFLMLGVSVIAYLSGIIKSKVFTKISIIMVLFVLGIFKYYGFFVGSFCRLFDIQRHDAINIILPVGISFYTFQAISYIVDVYREDAEAESNFINVALYISFFPQLVAGPIVRATDFMHQLKEKRNVSLKNLECGIQIFIFGLFKKMVLADRLAVFVDEVYVNPNMYNGITVILAIISYSMQIYFDFSGYSDMAIGAARCLGYDLPRNFNMPYISQNVSEFWKRWHISLSSWLKQYLYIPLGGNRKGKIRTYGNLLITMALGGLWHGANWTFVIWGILHGIALCIHKMWLVLAGNKKAVSLGTKAVSCILTFIFVTLCWIFFRSDSLETAFLIFRRMFNMSEGVVHIYSYTIMAIVLTIICQFMAIMKSRGYEKSVSGYYMVLDLTKVWSLVIFFVAIGLTVGLAYTGASPFIYFQF